MSVLGDILGFALLAAVVVLSAVIVRREYLLFRDDTWPGLIEATKLLAQELAAGWRDALELRDPVMALFMLGTGFAAFLMVAFALAFVVGVFAVVLWLVL